MPVVRSRRFTYVSTIGATALTPHYPLICDPFKLGSVGTTRQAYYTA